MREREGEAGGEAKIFLTETQAVHFKKNLLIFKYLHFNLIILFLICFKLNMGLFNFSNTIN